MAPSEDEVLARGWGTRVSIFQPRKAAFWLYALLLLYGALTLVALFAPRFVQWPLGSVVALLLLVAYTIPIAAYINHLDLFEREPRGMLLGAFLWGGLIATALALTANRAVEDLASKLVGPDFSSEWSAAIAGATDEETLKVLGVITLVLIARAQFNGLVDGFVYGALVGLGFQVVEDQVYALNSVAMSGGENQVGSVVGILFLRGILTGLYSHTLYTAVSGMGIAFVATRPGRPLLSRLGVGFLLFAAAWGMHFFWNSPLITGMAGGSPSGVAALLRLLASILVKGVPGFLFFLLLFRVAMAREVHGFEALVAGEVESGAITRDELATLTSLRRRRAARHRARERQGTTAARLVRALQRQQLALALALARAPDQGATDLEARRAAIRETRAALAALPVRPRPQVVDGGALLKAGFVAWLVEAALSLAIRGVGVASGAVPPDFEDLAPPSIITTAALWSIASVVALAILGHASRRPGRIFRISGAVVLAGLILSQLGLLGQEVDGVAVDASMALAMVAMSAVSGVFTLVQLPRWAVRSTVDVAPRQRAA